MPTKFKTYFYYVINKVFKHGDLTDWGDSQDFESNSKGIIRSHVDLV